MNEEELKELLQSIRSQLVLFEIQLEYDHPISTENLQDTQNQMKLFVEKITMLNLKNTNSNLGKEKILK